MSIPLLSGLFAAAAFAVLAGCDGNATASTNAAPQAPPPTEVSVLEMQPTRVPIVLEAVARTEGSREVEVRARVSGILERQAFREGETIRAGAPMYRIERAPFEIALAQARAALAQEKARLERARIEAERLAPLVENRAISRREYDDAVSNRQQSSAALQLAQARVREAELNLSYTAVNAPISGITGRALRSEGSLVQAGTESSLLTTVTRADPIWVRFALSEPEYLQLREAGERASSVRVALPDGGVYERAGRLNFTGSTIDGRLGTVQLRAEFPNPSLQLLPGQFVKALVQVGERDAFVVPQVAVQQSERGRFVWVIDPSDRAEQRFVQTDGWSGHDWVVREGLNAGDRVAIDNVLRLRPGAGVTPKPTAAAMPVAGNASAAANASASGSPQSGPPH
ncbi:MAG TPA: efflux RND transporter periplasmic adaptor subunit [Zeimonas sp.]